MIGLGLGVNRPVKGFGRFEYLSELPSFVPSEYSLAFDASGAETLADYEAGTLYFRDSNFNRVGATFSRTTTATRVNKQGLIESVATNVPRIDYTDGSAKLLMEPSRTNLITQSEVFTAWTNDTNTSLTANAIASPSGSIDAYKLSAGTSTARQAITISLTPTGDIVQSVFAKKGEYTVVQLTNGRSATLYANFDLENGVLGSYADCTPSIEAFSDGWYRCVITYNTVLDINVARISIAETTTQGRLVNFAGNGSDGLYIWGAQLEAGSYPTSYIPTAGSTVTRNAEVWSAFVGSTYFGSASGVAFTDMEIFQDPLNGWAIRNGSSNLEYAGIQLEENRGVRIVQRDNGGSTNVSSFAGSISLNTPFKVLLKYAPSDYAVWLNGSEILTTSYNTFDAGDIVDFTLSSQVVGQPAYGKLSKAIFFPTALTDTELQQLTS